MTEPTSGYLTELERAVRDLPRSLADDIVRGVREELEALDPVEAKVRIAELGDPEFIAASAREGAVVERGGDPGWYTVVTVLLVAVGWVVGVVLLWASKTWTRRDKLIGTLVFPGIALVGVLVSLSVGSGIQMSGGGFSPLASGVLTSAVIAPLITTPYLLLRARRREALPAGVAPDRHDALWYTVLTVVLLLIGGIVVQYVGWIIGLVLLWGSRTWRPVDKIIGSLVLPFGGQVTFFLLFRGAYSGEDPPLGVVVLAWIVSALPLVTFVYLLVRARILRR